MPSPRKPHGQRIRGLARAISSFVGALVVGAIGWVLAQSSCSVGSFGEKPEPRFGWLCGWLGEQLARLSYDLPFILRGTTQMQNACIVYLDENSARNLGQTGAIWDRKLHTQLLDRLAEDKPRAIFFDIVFSDDWPDPKVDDAFAKSIAASGRVFLAAALESEEGKVEADGVRIFSRRVIAPVAALRRAAAGWGLIAFQPLDGDYGVRRISPGTEDVPSAPWRIATTLGANLDDAPDARLQPRWLNYYGPAGAFEAISYDHVIGENHPPPGYFRDRIVVVGGRSTLAGLGFGKDDFRNPFSRIGAQYSTGAEIHLTALLNLLNGEWLTRLDAIRESWSIAIFGIVLGGALPRFRPNIAALLALFSALAISALAYKMCASNRIWFAWCVPAFAQIPIAFFWALGSQYFLEERRRKALRNAFGHYLSPHIADKIADSDFELAPGGSVVEASVLFTDLEGFTTLTEELKNPELITQVLLKYFAQTTAPILENEGTIINFVGDAVTAVWGAPLADRDHARKAALAAWKLHESARIEVDGHKLRTRVGLHTGFVLAGNVGSAERFDYAVVGDPVNFASRLEGLNKYFGTNVLISEEMRAILGGEFLARNLGEIRVVGKTETRVIHEFLGPSANRAMPEWCAIFENGIEAFRRGDFDEAGRKMRETIELRGGADGPAQFYISRIDELKRAPVPPGWSGIVEFSSK